MYLQVLGEIAQILPNLAKTRWRKKSDFYTLFVTMSKYSSQLPLAAEKRDLAASKLVSFSAAVDDAMKADRDNNIQIEPRVADYFRYVERAASDLGSRQQRERVLTEVLMGVF